MILRTVFLLLFGSAIAACGPETPSIDFGHAECAHCRMNVVDRRFGAALRTLKGRQYVFDDLACMVQYVKDGTVAEEQVAHWYVCDHAHPGTLIDATKAFYLHGPGIQSPMRGDMAAFAQRTDLLKFSKGDSLHPLDWSEARSRAVR